MVTGASTADVAVVLLDARKGVIEQTRRHSYIAGDCSASRTSSFASTRWTSSTSTRQRFDEIDAELRDARDAARRRATRSRSRSRRCTATTSSTRSERDALVRRAARCSSTSRRSRSPATATLARPALPGAVGDPADVRRAPRLPRLRRPGRRRRSGAPATRCVVLPSGLAHPGRGGRAAPTGRSRTRCPGMSVTIRLDDDLDVSRGDMLADPDDPPVDARASSRHASAG